MIKKARKFTMFGLQSQYNTGNNTIKKKKRLLIEVVKKKKLLQSPLVTGQPVALKITELYPQCNRQVIMLKKSLPGPKCGLQQNMAKTINLQVRKQETNKMQVRKHLTNTLQVHTQCTG